MRRRVVLKLARRGKDSYRKVVPQGELQVQRGLERPETLSGHSKDSREGPESGEPDPEIWLPHLPLMSTAPFSHSNLFHQESHHNSSLCLSITADQEFRRTKRGKLLSLMVSSLDYIRTVHISSLEYFYTSSTWDSLWRVFHCGQCHVWVPLSHLDSIRTSSRDVFFDFPCDFNTFQPLLLRGRLEGAGVHCYFAAWTYNYLTNSPQSATRGPRDAVLSPFTLNPTQQTSWDCGDARQLLQ